MKMQKSKRYQKKPLKIDCFPSPSPNTKGYLSEEAEGGCLGFTSYLSPRSGFISHGACDYALGHLCQHCQQI